MDQDVVLKFIGELSLNVYMLKRELAHKDEEIAKLRATVEKLSSGARGN